MVKTGWQMMMVQTMGCSCNAVRWQSGGGGGDEDDDEIAFVALAESERGCGGKLTTTWQTTTWLTLD